MKKLLAIERMQRLSAIEVAFHEATLDFVQYPFGCASVAEKRMVNSAEIASVNTNAAPPEIHLHSGEIIFLYAPEKVKLQKWAARNQISERSQIDIWSLLLEPFLDTEMSETWQARCFAQLARCGIERSEVAAIRKSVSSAMMTYNFSTMLWEWVHLGLYDVLVAQSGYLKKDAYKAFYRDAMALAQKGF